MSEGQLVAGPTAPMAVGPRGSALTAIALGVAGCLAVAWIWVPMSPVPGGFPAPVDATTVFSAQEIARAESFSRVARWLGWGSLSVASAVSLWLGFSRWGARLTAHLHGPRWMRTAQAVLLVLALGRVATLPFAVLAWRWRTRYGLTEQPLIGLLRDVGVSLLVTAAVTSLAIVLLVWLAQRLPRSWPLAAGALLAGSTLAVSFAYPLVVEPLFNDFTPLPAGQLRSDVLSLADREGVQVGEVLVADASRRTTTLNAYVSGFGSSRRVVLYDTLVDSLPRDQILAVTAHELAHARQRDVWWGSLQGAFAVLLALGLLAFVVPSPAPSSVPRVLALLTAASLLSTPAQSAISRRIEWRADVDALAAGADPVAVEALQRNLAVRGLADPSPPALAYFLFGTHPQGLQRVALARRSAESSTPAADPAPH